MAAYSISSINVKDWDKYKVYMDKVPAVIQKYGGRYVVRGGEIISNNTGLELKRIVILEFPSVDQLNAFRNSPEYVPLSDIREKASDTIGFTVQS
jgi:uncharacterized protein (DUF1330 family)